MDTNTPIQGNIFFLDKINIIMVSVRFASIFGVLFFVIGRSTAQEIEKIVQSFAKADVETILHHMDTIVDLCLFEEEHSYSKSEAGKLLEDFFDSYPIKSVLIEHRGASGYVLCKLYLTSKTLRLYLYTRREDNRLVLDEIRIVNP